MTGLPAETRRRFRFFRAPEWSTIFLLLMCVGVGFLLSGILIFLVARKVTGFLPLTSESSRRLSLVRMISLALMGVALALLSGAAVLSAAREPLAQLAALLLLSLGLIAFLFGFTGLQIGLQVLKPLFGPTAVVLPRQPRNSETWLELRNVHPAFVAAVQQRNAHRVAHHAAE